MATDSEQITALMYSYAARLDGGDFEGVAKLFAHATIRSDGIDMVVRGSEEALELYRNSAMLYDGKPCTKHVTTNVIVEVDASGNSATARAYFTVLQARPEFPLQPIIAGRYHDTFARIDGAWCFTDRLMFVDLIGDLRYHLKYSLPQS